MDIDAKGFTSLFWDITFIRRYLLLYHFVLPFSYFFFIIELYTLHFANF